jgi:hypothetical protein
MLTEKEHSPALDGMVVYDVLQIPARDVVKICLGR